MFIAAISNRLRATLFEPTTGKVYDKVRTNGRIGRFSLTYNQCTFVGAANFLGFTNEARLAALYTMNQLCRMAICQRPTKTATVADSTELACDGLRGS